MALKRYGRLYNVGHSQVRDILSHPVVIQEKIDGSQFSFGIDGQGNLSCRSKGAELNLDAPERMFIKAVEQVQLIKHLLVPNWTYRGEYLQSPKHNTLAYDRTPKNNIILFDVDQGQENYLRPTQLSREAERLGFEAVPVLLYTESSEGLTLDEMQGLLNQVSVLGGQKIEGFVIKAYGRFGEDGFTLMAKHVSEAFKEVHSKDWKERSPNGKGDIIETLVQQYRTPARWNKAIQHLREAGLLTDTPKDIGPIMKEVERDVLEEEGEAIKAKVFKMIQDRFLRGVTGGVAQHYKNELLKKQVGE